MADTRIMVCARALVKHIGYGDQVPDLKSAEDAARACILKWLEQKPGRHYHEDENELLAQAIADIGLKAESYPRDQIYDAAAVIFDGCHRRRIIDALRYVAMCEQAKNEIMADVPHNPDPTPYGGNFERQR